MSKRQQKRVVAKSKPMMSLVSKTAIQSQHWVDTRSTKFAYGETCCEGLNENTALSSDANMDISMERPEAATLNRLLGTMLSNHNFQIHNVDHLETVSSNVRQKLSLSHRDKMLDIDVNVMIW